MANYIKRLLNKIYRPTISIEQKELVALTILVVKLNQKIEQLEKIQKKALLKTIEPQSSKTNPTNKNVNANNIVRQTTKQSTISTSQPITLDFNKITNKKYQNRKYTIRTKKLLKKMCIEKANNLKMDLTDFCTKYNLPKEISKPYWIQKPLKKTVYTTFLHALEITGLEFYELYKQNQKKGK